MGLTEPVQAALPHAVRAVEDLLREHRTQRKGDRGDDRQSGEGGRYSRSGGGFIAGPDDSQDWIFDFMTNDTTTQQEAAAATGAMLVGRRTIEVGERREADQERGTDSAGEGSLPRTDQAVATALDAAGGKDLQILGADVAAQCLRRGLVDEIEVYVVPILLGDGIRFFSSPDPGR